MSDRGRAYRALALSTLAFAVCFSAWALNGVLVTFLVGKGLFAWDKSQMGLLIGAPVLTGAVMRLPLGLLTDRYGGRTVFPVLMALAAVPMYLLSYADSFPAFLLASFGFGLAGSSFAVGVAYTSVWFQARQQGMALGIFGMGNLGTALTAMGAPLLLNLFTDGGSDPEGWRLLPRVYAGGLVAMGIAFWLLTSPKKPESAGELSLAARLAPLRYIRVWRFGLYYSFFFGGFVAVSQWLIPYYVNMYALSLGLAGLLAATFAFPASVVRGFGGWLSDRRGARAVMYWTLGVGTVTLILMFPPRMDIQTPGPGVMADRPGTVTAVSPQEVVLDDVIYQLQEPTRQRNTSVRVGVPASREPVIFFPKSILLYEPVVQVGDTVERGQLLAQGTSHIYFQANLWVFLALTVILGLMMGTGSAAVYKHVSSYYPGNVGVVGGIVGVLGGLGGFVLPIVFGYLLAAVGVWTTAWMLLALVGLISLMWMHLVIQRMMRRRVPDLMRHIEESSGSA